MRQSVGVVLHLAEAPLLLFEVDHDLVRNPKRRDDRLTIVLLLHCVVEHLVDRHVRLLEVLHVSQAIA